MAISVNVENNSGSSIISAANSSSAVERTVFNGGKTTNLNRVRHQTPITIAKCTVRFFH